MDTDVIRKTTISRRAIGIARIVCLDLFRTILFIIGFAFSTSKARQRLCANANPLPFLDQCNRFADAHRIANNFVTNCIVNKFEESTNLRPGRWLGPNRQAQSFDNRLPNRSEQCGDRFRKPTQRKHVSAGGMISEREHIYPAMRDLDVDIMPLEIFWLKLEQFQRRRFILRERSVPSKLLRYGHFTRNVVPGADSAPLQSLLVTVLW
jgi:hypothetical protein